MNTLETGRRLVELCQAGENRRAVEELYADDAVSLEAVMDAPPEARIKRGKDTILKASDEWYEMFEVHGAGYEGPYPCDDEFIVPQWADVTARTGDMAGQRFTVHEAGKYTVRDGKIVEARFYYDMGG